MYDILRCLTLISEQKYININVANTRFIHYKLINPPAKRKKEKKRANRGTCCVVIHVFERQ
jgi:hypothetical protein